MQTYKVGSILYLIPESNFMSVPVQVVEEVIRKSISGETIDHYVQIPGKEETTLLRDIKAEVFEDLAQVKQHLLNLANQKVEKIISQTQELTLTNFEVKEEPDVFGNKPKKNSKSSRKKETTKNQIELQNGQKANIVMSEEIKELLS